jgi:Glycosyl transferase family 11
MSVVYVRLIGGLGNQIFQYATGRALAMRTNASLKLDTSGYETYGLRRYELDSFPIEAGIALPEELATIIQPNDGPRSFLDRLLALRKASTITVYREPSFHFDSGLVMQLPPVYLDGYWQSERYFANIATELRRELTPTLPLDSSNSETAAQIDAVEAVSLHVRRGDYVTDPTTNAYHGTCSLDYYKRAIDYVCSHVAKLHLFVFSDDHGWTRENLVSDLQTTYVTANPPERGFRDLQLMSRCKHHIIANSSFSWWGAWLNPSPNKIVVAPKRWFNTLTHDTSDLIPQSWVRL